MHSFAPCFAKHQNYASEHALAFNRIWTMCKSCGAGTWEEWGEWGVEVYHSLALIKCERRTLIIITYIIYERDEESGLTKDLQRNLAYIHPLLYQQ